jgi:hypothetical protein
MLAAFPTLATAAAALALSRVMKQLPGDSRSADFRG